MHGTVNVLQETLNPEVGFASFFRRVRLCFDDVALNTRALK